MKTLFFRFIVATLFFLQMSCSGFSNSDVSGSTAVSTFAGRAGVSGSTDGTGSAARFDNPLGIATDGTNFYVTDSNNNTIRQIVIATGVVSTLAGTAGVTGSADGTGAAAEFSSPRGVATDGTNLYVADSDNNTIRQIVISSGVVTTLAGTAGVSGSTDATGTSALFDDPLGIATDGTNLYVTDSNNNTIRQIVISSGVVTTLAGTAGVTGSADGTGAAAEFSSPRGVATDGTNLYVADSGNSIIRQIVISSGVVTALAGSGTFGSDDGIGTAATFRFPVGIFTDGTNLYVADSGNSTIRQIVISSGVVTTLAGTAQVTGTTDGTTTAALFNTPFGIAVDSTNLYVTDSVNNTIRKIINDGN